jgi:hypothetical protein
MLDGGPRGDGGLQQCGHHREGGVRGGGCRLRATLLSGSLPLQQVMIESTFCLFVFVLEEETTFTIGTLQLVSSCYCSSAKLRNKRKTE